MNSIQILLDIEVELTQSIFAYGVFLQLIDDLQDVKEDLDNNHMTIFSNLATKFPLDKLVIELLANKSTRFLVDRPNGLSISKLTP